MGGYVRTPGQAIPLQLDAAVRILEAGMVVRVSTTDQEGELADSTSTPYGIALDNTMNAAKFGLTGEKEFETGKVIAVVRSGQMRLPLSTRHSEIDVGQQLVVGHQSGRVTGSSRTTVTDGTTAENEFARLARVVAIADEHVDASTGNDEDDKAQATVLASITIGMGAGP